MLNLGILLASLLPLLRFQVAGEVVSSIASQFHLVEIESIDRRFVEYETIDSDGKFLFKKIPEGLYKITVTATDGHEEQRTVEVRAAFADAHSRVTVKIELQAERIPTDQFKVGVAALDVSPKAARELQRSYDARGDIDKARQHLEKAIDISPRFPEALNNLGTIYYRNKDFKKAAELFEKAAKASPTFYPAVVNLGGALISLADYDRALPANLKAIAMRPNDSLAQSQLGQVYYHLKRYDEALDHLETARRIDPMSFTLPDLFIADIHQARGEIETAIATYREFLKTHPGNENAAWVQSQIRLLEEHTGR
jgi:tetratricopeptide (TPR) repeat protein